MNPLPKHVPFQSAFRPDFEVVEERQGNLHLFPHTDQLPRLQRALNLEFKNALPGHIARVDKRGDGFHKILLKHACLDFCSFFNAARPDRLLLFALPDLDLVSRVAVVQQITEETRQGPLHWFKFYGGPDFFTEPKLSGRRLKFADHVLQRYSTRVPNNVGEDCSRLLLVIFGGPQIMLRVGPERAFVASYDPSLVAFPFKVTDTEFILTTCLTVNEINTMEQEMPPLVFNLHYGDSFTVPRLRHWYPTKLMADLYTRWERKAQLPPPPEALPPRLNWHWVAAHLTDLQKVRGHGPGSQLLFWDRVPGPCTFDLKPGEAEPQLDECEFYRQASPGPDWVKAFAARDQAIVPPTPGNDCKY